MFVGYFGFNVIHASQFQEESPFLTKELIEKSLRGLGLTDLIKNTDIVQKLEVAKKPGDVFVAVEVSYAQRYRSPAMVSQRDYTDTYAFRFAMDRNNKLLMYTVLLQEYPEWLSYLQEGGSVEKNKIVVHLPSLSHEKVYTC